jgi:hypothetical protein
MTVWYVVRSEYQMFLRHSSMDIGTPCWKRDLPGPHKVWLESYLCGYSECTGIQFTRDRSSANTATSLCKPDLDPKCTYCLLKH